ncbi:MAG TPA: enoyl-CoA hydratase-related protein [Bdellovibrionota bacterium]|jgi:enoyl-CoA hydratase|nr:enoyl-CoA hydratase-related protein [Bdellovibrionota bacterium]
MTNSAEVLLVETREVAGALVEVWTVNREKNLNALNTAVLKRVHEETQKLGQRISNNKNIRALVIRGAGEKAFVAGADITEMVNFGESEAKVFSKLGHAGFGALEELPIPVIAAVEGFALGGGLELAMGCDMIFASKKSKFGQPEATLGLIPGFGATARFVEKLGRSKALEFFYSNAMMSAEEALKYGLIERVIEEGSVLEAALDYLKIVITKSGPVAVAEVKRIATLLHAERVAHVCHEEAEAFGKIFMTEDKAEGVAAFLEKRAPLFKGK